MANNKSANAPKSVSENMKGKCTGSNPVGPAASMPMGKPGGTVKIATSKQPISK